MTYLCVRELGTVVEKVLQNFRISLDLAFGFDFDVD